MATPSASSIANALSARTQSASASQPAGMSPLVAGYQQWVGGSGMAAGLPRPVTDFLTSAFGPLSPIVPMPIDIPREDTGRPRPRRWEYPVGWNLPVGQPGMEGFKLAPFDTLRSLADRYSVVRAMLDLRINEMAGLNWDIGPTAEAEQASKGDKGKGKDQKERASDIVKWFKKIDTNYKGFQSWFTACLEDQHVIDALSLHVLPTRVNGKGLFGSDLAEMELLAGETIRPMLNIRGARPRPPAPAYQQYLWGVPRSDLMDIMTDRDLDHMADRLDEAGVKDFDLDPNDEFRSDELLYLPRWQRSWTPYGFSSIEKALLPITIGLNRQNFLLDYFTEGTIPGVYVIAGDQYVTPAQQRQLQDSLNALAGDVAWKHRVIVLPPGSTTDPQKDLAWQKDVDQNIVEQVAMILHIQPHEIGMVPGGRTSGLGGKGMAEAQQNSVVEQRTQPDRKWWKETLFDWIIQRVFQQEDLEWKWLDFEEEEDAGTKATAQVAKTHGGLTTIDQERIEDGLDPFNLPLTQTPFLFAGGQVIPLDPTVTPPTPPGGMGGPPIGPDGKPLPQIGPDGKPIPPKPAIGPDGKPILDAKGSPIPHVPPDTAPQFGKPKQLPPGGDDAAGPTTAQKPSGPPSGPSAHPAPASGSAAPSAAPEDQPKDAPAKDAPAKDGDKPFPPKKGEDQAAADASGPAKDPQAPDFDHHTGPVDHQAKPEEPGSHGHDSDHKAGDPLPTGTPQQAAADANNAADDAKDAAKDKDANRAAKDAQRAADDANTAAAATDKPKPKPGKQKGKFGKAAEGDYESLTVADLVKGKIRYKGDLTDIVYRYLLRSYPKDAVKWVKDKGGEWEYDPHVALKDINMARRPGGRNPEKVGAISDSLDHGASMDPIVLVRRDPPNGFEYDIADGWHRTLGADDAKWDDVPAFIGSGFDDKADWGLEMQDESDSKKKSAYAELAVLRRFIRKPENKVENFRTAVIDSDIMRMFEVDIAKMDRDEALERARDRIGKASGNPQGLRDWYNDGADGQIDWGSDGDFDQCVNVASGYMSDEDAKGFCNLRHQDAVGVAPGQEKVDAAVVKYSDDQPRDELGRWAAEAGLGVREDSHDVGSASFTLTERHGLLGHSDVGRVRAGTFGMTNSALGTTEYYAEANEKPGAYFTDARSAVSYITGKVLGKDFSVGGGVSGGGVQLVPYDLDTGPRPKEATCPQCGAALVDGECPIHGTAVTKSGADLLKAIDAELARRGVIPLEKGTPLHGWEHVPEGRRTRKAKRPAGMAPGIAGVERDGKRYGVGVGRDDAGVFVHTHRARSESYRSLDDIPTKALEFVDSTGAATSDLNKYSEDQPRDDHGRFASGGGSGADREPAGGHEPMSVVECAAAWCHVPSASMYRDALRAGQPSGFGHDAEIYREAATLLEAANKADPTTTPLYRGVDMKADDYSKVGTTFMQGARVDLNMASWTTNEKLAAAFGTGQHEVMFALEPGAHAFDLSDQSPSEHVTAGRFEVEKVDHSDTSDVITLKQVGLIEPEQMSGKVAAIEGKPAFLDWLEPYLDQRMVAKVQKYSDDEPRDDHGRWTGGADPASVTLDANVAADELRDGKQPTIHRDEVGALLSEFPLGSKDADLTELKVAGTLKFGGDGLGYARAAMPQIPPERRAEFVAGLGAKAEDENVRPQDLHPIQKEISSIGVNHLLGDMRLNGVGTDRSLVSKDNYILDGHHHWAAATALSFEKDDVQIPITRIDLGHAELLDKALKWDATQGVSHESFDDKPVK